MDRKTSLRRKLLRMLLSGMLLMMVASAFIAYSIAFRSASRAYDRALLDTALGIAGQIHVSDNKLALVLPKEAEEILLTDNLDQIFFQVVDANGNSLGGNSTLPMPQTPISPNSWKFYNAEINGAAVRVAAFSTERAHLPLTVLSAETRVKRTALVREILIGMLLPEMVLVGVTLVLVWFGIRTGLQPLEDLRQQLSQRSQNDLQPLAAEDMAYEVKPLIRELNHLLGQLDESVQAQRNFVSNAAHQLRTPIAALHAQIEAMLGEPEGPQRAQVSQVLTALQRLAHLIHQLLALARAEPKDESSRQAVELTMVVRNVADTLLAHALDKNIDLGFDLAPATARGSALLLQEAATNLADNAIRYTPAGGSVTVGCGQNAEYAFLCVEDSGPGIPEALRERVFERFYRLPGTQGNGCGLGLAIVRQIARQHGAEVVIEHSETLGGARIELRFPLAS